MPRTIARALLLAFLLVLALPLPACGGGGGGGEGPTPTPAPQPDPELDQDLRITSTSPVADAMDAATNGRIEMRFSGRLDQTQNLPSFVSVSILGQPVAGTTIFVSPLNMLRFTPAGDLPMGVRVDVEIAAGLRDVDGNERTIPYTFGFDTATSSFDNADAFTSTTYDEHVEFFKLRADGTGLIVTVQDRSSTKRLLAYPYSTETGVGSPFTVREAANLSSHGGCVDLAANGDAIVGWRESVGGQGNCYIRRFDGQLGWQSTRTIESSDLINAATPRCKMSDDGSIVVTNAQAPLAGSWDRLRGTTYTRVGGWSLIEDLHPALGTHDGVTWDMSASGRAVFWMRTFDGSLYRQYGRTWAPNEGWSAHNLLFDRVDSFGVYESAIGPAGHAVAVFEYDVNDGTSNYKLYGVRYGAPGTPNPGFGAVHPIEPVAFDSTEDVFIHVNSEGDAHVVYEMADPDDLPLRTLRYDRDLGWQPKHTFDRPGYLPGSPGRVAMAEGEGRSAYATWYITAPDGTEHVHASRWTPATGWAPSRSIRTLPDQFYSVIHTAVRPNGAQLVAWHERALGAEVETVRGRWVYPDGSLGDLMDLTGSHAGVSSEAWFGLDAQGRGAVVWGITHRPGGRKGGVASSLK